MRHRDSCGCLAITQVQVIEDEARERTVRTELDHVFVRVNKMLDACDAWLQDPDDPGKYFLGPRAQEVQIVYIEWRTEGKRRLPMWKKGTLAALLEKITGNGIDVERVESRQADPRDLLLKTAGQLTKQVELLAKLTGELDDRDEINILTNPQWLVVENAILKALEPYPHVLEDVRVALLAVE